MIKITIYLNICFSVGVARRRHRSFKVQLQKIALLPGDLQDIQARCGSVSLVIVDYVQLIEPREKRGGENRV
ncbi:hypothetical protein [uncultured Nostoc sp.]|uniref:hypothetical protein n=1 Tax=uncultured Nostoc sp. TaxID=340711 RepID=UPI0035CC6630